jgi:manganese transport protein
MGQFASPVWVKALAWTASVIIVSLNIWLVLGEVGGFVTEAAETGRRVGPVPLSWLVAGGLYGLLAGAQALLVWVTVKPWIRPSASWAPEEPVSLDWADALRPRKMERIGVALERSAADAGIINRALTLARPGETRLVLLHVSDTPMTQIYGAETGDRHTEADEHYLDEVARALEERGYAASAVLLYGEDRAGLLVGQLKREPVDLLVVGSHGHGAIMDLMLGQTVDKVRHGLDIPLLISRPEADVAAEAAAAVGRGLKGEIADGTSAP